MAYIGIDVGATKIAAGVVSNGKIIQIIEVPTKSKKSKNIVLNQIFVVIEKLMDKSIKGIGIGVPTIVDDKGILYDTPNIPSWKKLDLVRIISRKYKVPVRIENDANCFALGELHYGKGKKIRNFVGITVGSGLGAGIIINRKLYRGQNGCSGEFGHVPFRDGELENFCTKQFFTKRKLDGLKVCKRAIAGDKEAIKLYEDFGELLGEGLAIIVNSLAPEAIILGGSVTHAHKFFKRTMMSSLKQWTFRNANSGLKIYYSSLKSSGILGAASLLKNK